MKMSHFPLDGCGGCFAVEALTPQISGFGDAITAGSQADSTTKRDRKYNVKIAARPQK